MNGGCGVVYVASKADRYVEEAFLSADSIKQRYPKMPVTLFTDRQENPLCKTDRFDQVTAINGISGFASSSAEGKLNRLSCLLRSPYSNTLYLDTDTRILTGEVRVLFDLLKDHDVGMVETSVDDSFSRRHVGQPMFNSGVIIFRRNDRTQMWLTEWVAVSTRNFLMASQSPIPINAPLAHIVDESLRRRLLFMDQVSHAEILSPAINKIGLSCITLDYSWNHRGSRLPENNRAPVRILHSPALKILVHADLLAAAFYWSRLNRRDQSKVIYSYVATKYAESSALGVEYDEDSNACC